MSGTGGSKHGRAGGVAAAGGEAGAGEAGAGEVAVGADVTVAVRVRPGASRTRVAGERPGRWGAALVVAVTAPATGGRATEAARRALAEALGVPASSVSLRTGATSRDKLFIVASAPPGLSSRLQVLRGGRG